MINTNLPPILHRFWDIADDRSEIAILRPIFIMAALCNRGPLYFCPVVSFFLWSPYVIGQTIYIFWVGFNVPLHIIGHIGDGFYGPNDPTNSVKALKEVMVLRIRLQSHQVHLTMLQYYTCMQYTVRHKIIHKQLECGPMPNLMVALPNIGGALCSTPQSLADAHY